jgi:bifunctional non-homologous end joining protein LigD
MFMVARAGDFPRGIQIWIPIARGPSFDDTHGWTEQLSRAVGGAVPELVSWEWNVRDRDGLARLDYTAPC